MSPNLTSAQIARMDRDFDKFLDGVRFNISDAELTPEKRHLRKTACANDPLLFAKTYYPDIFSREWSPLHFHIVGLKQGKYTIEAYPESGKSALTFVVHVIRNIALQIGGVINVSLRTLDMAERRTKSLMRLLENNRLLMYDYDLRILESSGGWHVIGNTTLLATSYMVGLRGNTDERFQRFKISIQDDLYNRQSVRSETDNKAVVDFVTGEAYRQLQTEGLAITLGNAITKDCPILRLAEMAPDNHFAYPAMKKDSEGLWVSSDPDYRSTDEWLAARDGGTIPWHIWNGEYMGTPAEEGNVFSKDDFSFIHVPNLKILAAVTAIDPAHGENPNSCKKGIVTMGYAEPKSGRPLYPVLDIFYDQAGYFDIFNYLDALIKSTPAHKAIYFENDFAQWDLAKPYYEAWRLTSQKSLAIIRFSSKTVKTEQFASDKYSRIMRLVYPHQMAEVRYSDTLQGSAHYERHYYDALAFGPQLKAKVDSLDAMASAFYFVQRYRGNGGPTTFIPAKTRTWESKWNR
jgi:hypothetical protein